MRRDGFTLIELLVSVTILSIIMIYLYQSYASLNRSNSFYKVQADSLEKHEVKKNLIYLDFSLALDTTNSIIKKDKIEDTVSFKTSNSLHKRYNPYIAYMVNDSKLYRLESLKKLIFPLSQDNMFDVDYLGDVNSFRVYKHDKKLKTKTSELYLVHIDFKKEEEILLKIRVLNEK